MSWKIKQAIEIYYWRQSTSSGDDSWKWNIAGSDSEDRHSNSVASWTRIRALNTRREGPPNEKKCEILNVCIFGLCCRCIANRTSTIVHVVDGVYSMLIIKIIYELIYELYFSISMSYCRNMTSSFISVSKIKYEIKLLQFIGRLVLMVVPWVVPWQAAALHFRLELVWAKYVAYSKMHFSILEMQFISCTHCSKFCASIITENVFRDARAFHLFLMLRSQVARS